ncbi:MAG: prepilin-type N-terminal cleavage/methylation domain-containing protein [Pirellulales bacterium]|nr:prepilin-type N-terminal cleavage/methylation domain-containing protein [Pirellulales bacterium]
MNALHGRPGFTLVEVLIAAVLTSTLMVMLWGLMSTYADLFEMGKARTEQSQFARSLLGQMAADLAGAIQEPPAPARLAGASDAAGATVAFEMDAAVRRFGLFGTSRELRLDVMAITPEQTLALPARDGVLGESTSDRPGSEVPELRTIHYTFVSPEEIGEEPSPAAPAAESEDDPLPHRAGLFRREWDFQTSSQPRESDRARGTVPIFAPAKMGLSPSSAGRDVVGPEDDPSLQWLPEVVGLEFRYFDGQGWTSEWDSIARRSLPVAIEVRVEIESFDPRDLRRAAMAANSHDEEVDVVGAEGPDAVEMEGEAEPVLPDRRRTYRLVVELGTAAAHPGVKRPAGSLGTRRATLPVPALPAPLRPNALPLPPAPRRDSPAPARLNPDQWLRTDSPGGRR